MLVRHYFEAGLGGGARHSHPHHQLVYVVSGAIRVDVDGRVFDVRGGRLVLWSAEGSSIRLRRWEPSEVLGCGLPQCVRTIGELVK